jgi:FdhE protein
MTQLESPYGPRSIGDEAAPIYAILPDPAVLFAMRAKRLRALAPGHMLEIYLCFVADINEAQQRTLAKLPAGDHPNQDRVRQSLEYALPPLSRTDFEPVEEAATALPIFLGQLQGVPVPEEAATAIGGLAATSDEIRVQLVRDALGDVPTKNIAERVLVLAALQVYFSKLSAHLQAEDLRPIADGVCPACGSPPMSSSVVGWPKAHNLRFCTCSLCGTMWNVVRIKCVLCSSTAGIGYQSIEGNPETIKAETCDSCGRYVKILYQVKDHLLEPLADDVASLDLDMLLAGQRWNRGGQNPFLLGY